MKSSSCRSMLNSPAWPASRGGARRHPHFDIEIHGEAAERLHGFLCTVQNELLSRERIRLTHTNSSPTNPGWFKCAPRRGARGQDAVIENQVHPRPRRQHGEPLQQLQRIEAQVRRAVGPPVPQREPDLAVARPVQPLLRERWPQRVAAQPLQAIAAAGSHDQPRVQIETRWRARDTNPLSLV
jgi:hypothetical protein